MGLTTQPKLSADDKGVWCESTPGQVSGIEWHEVHKVGAFKQDGVTEAYNCIELDFEYGEFVQLYDCWPGFTQVIAEITARLPGIDPDWYERVTHLGVNDPSIEVWRRRT